MSLPNHHPAYLRYLKARLKPFKRPTFWASALGLLLVLLFSWEYWRNPQRFSVFGEKATPSSNTPDVEPTLSAEELAAVTADIDNSSVLLEEVNRTNILPLTPSNQNPQAPNTEGLFAQAFPQPEATDSNGALSSQTLKPQETPSTSNPFAKPAQEFLNPSSVSQSVLFRQNSQNRPSSTTDTATDSGLSFNTNQGTASVNPLQSALDRVAVTNAIRTTNATQAPTNAQQASSAPTYQGQVAYPATTVPGITSYPAPTTPTAPPNSFTYLVPSQSANSLPGAIPVTPVAPTTTGNYGQYSTQPLGQVNGVPNPGFNSTLRNPGLQPSQVNQQTFTTPNSVPGQYIGGGQINTFSNP